MVDLSLEQWWICLGLASSLVVVEELIKIFIRRRSRNGVPVGVYRTPAVA